MDAPATTFRRLLIYSTAFVLLRTFIWAGHDCRAIREILWNIWAMGLQASAATAGVSSDTCG